MPFFKVKLNNHTKGPFSEKLKGDSFCWLTKVHNCRESKSGADVTYSDNNGVRLLITGNRAASPSISLSEKWIPLLCSFLLPLPTCTRSLERRCVGGKWERGRRQTLPETSDLDVARVHNKLL